MKKSEIKDGIKSIKLAIDNFKKNYEEQLKPIEDIREHFEQIKNIEEENCLDLEIEWEDIEGKAIRDMISNSADFTDIEEQIDYLISDLENWSYEVNENKSEQIQETYIQPLEELKELLYVDNIECVEDIKNMICDLENNLDECFII